MLLKLGWEFKSKFEFTNSLGGGRVDKLRLFSIQFEAEVVVEDRLELGNNDSSIPVKN